MYDIVTIKLISLSLYACEFCFFQCDCTQEYNDVLLHIMGHKVGKVKESRRQGINIVAGEYLQQKGQTLDDYVEFIKVPGHKGDELSVHLLACMTNFKVIIMMKTGYWSTVDDCDILSADIVLVYLRKSMFRNTVPIPTKPPPFPSMMMLN